MNDNGINNDQSGKKCDIKATTMSKETATPNEDEIESSNKKEDTVVLKRRIDQRGTYLKEVEK